MNINLTGCFLMAQATVKNMVRRGEGGRNVNITSVQGTAVWLTALHAPYEVLSC